MTGSKLQQSLVTTARRQVLGHSGPWTSDLTRAPMRRSPAVQPLVAVNGPLSLKATAESDPNRGGYHAKQQQFPQ